VKYLKQSTSVDVGIGPFLDNVDGFTAETGLTITQPDVRLKKNGGAWAQKAAAQTLAHEENGWYEVTLDATDTDTIGHLLVAIHESGALPVWQEYHVLAANVYDSLFGAATDKLDVNVEEWNTTAVPAEHTAGYPIVTVKDGTGAGELQTNTGRVDADILRVNGTAISTPSEAGVMEVAVKYWAQTLVPAVAITGVPKVDLTHIAGVAVSTTTAQLGVNVVQISTDATAADNAEAFFDGTGYAGTGNTIPTVTNVTTVNGLAAGVITAAAIATDAIDADAIALSAANEIMGSVSGTADSGSTTTVVDTERTEADTDYWKGSLITFTSGTLLGQTRLITAFDAGTDTLTFAPASTVAVSTHTYRILPFGRADLHLWLGSLVNALVSGRVDASVGAMAADTVTASAIATAAIDADALAADAVDEIWAKTMTELSAAPAINASTLAALSWVFSLARNKITQTATTQTVLKDDGSTTMSTSTLSDDATTFTRGEFT